MWLCSLQIYWDFYGTCKDSHCPIISRLYYHHYRWSHCQSKAFTISYHQVKWSIIHFCIFYAILKPYPDLMLKMWQLQGSKQVKYLKYLFYFNKVANLSIYSEFMIHLWNSGSVLKRNLERLRLFLCRLENKNHFKVVAVHWPGLQIAVWDCKCILTTALSAHVVPNDVKYTTNT